MKPIRFVVVTIVVAAQCIVVSTMSGQEQPSGNSQGIFSSVQQYNEFMSKLRAIEDPEIKQMVPAINDIIMTVHQRKKPTFGTPFNSQRSWMVRLLDNQGIRREIGMADYQLEDIKESSEQIQAQMADHIRELVRRTGSLSDSNIDTEKLRDQLIEIREVAEGELDRTLLPTQEKRLQQILMHGRLIREPLLRVVTSSPVAEELELTDDQKEMLKKEWQGIEKKLNEDIADLKAKARKELGSKLPKSQRRKYDDLFGEGFQFKANPTKGEDKDTDRQPDKEKERRRNR